MMDRHSSLDARGDADVAPTRPIDRLIAIMARLRDPERGCPWDVEQTSGSIARYAVEEAYELVDAIERGDRPAIRDELGDLLLQVVFHSRMAEESGAFAFDDVADAIAGKMIRRHPHVFAAADRPASADGQTAAWEQQKVSERAASARALGTAVSLLDNVPVTLPALTRAVKLQNRAARVGFDWPSSVEILAKMQEEITEVTAELEAPAAAFADGEAGRAERLEDEVGDLLFVVANLARKLSLDPEQALRRANAKFTRRFSRIEALLRSDGVAIDTAGLERLERLWQRVKSEEAAAAAGIASQPSSVA